jgi:hypothetical protein
MTVVAGLNPRLPPLYSWRFHCIPQSLSCFFFFFSLSPLSFLLPYCITLAIALSLLYPALLSSFAARIASSSLVPGRFLLSPSLLPSFVDPASHVQFPPGRPAYQLASVLCFPSVSALSLLSLVAVSLHSALTPLCFLRLSSYPFFLMACLFFQPSHIRLT